MRKTGSGSWLRFSLRTSWDPPSELSRLVIVHGANCSRHSVQKFGIRCVTSTGARSILRAMVSLRPSTARAIRCAGAIREAARSLGLEVRCGLHTGECELVGEDLAGIAVHIGAR